MTLLWLASSVGAVLFFLAGWLAGRAGRPPAVVAHHPPQPLLSPELAALKADLAAAQVAQLNDRTALQQVSHDLGAARAQVERLRIDLMRAQMHSNELREQLAGRQAPAPGALD